MRYEAGKVDINFKEIDASQDVDFLREAERALPSRNPILDAEDELLASTLDTSLTRVAEETAFLDPYQETGVLDWIRAGCPDRYELPHGTKIVSIESARDPWLTGKYGIEGHYSPITNEAVVKRMPKQTDIIQGMATGFISPFLDTVQHEAAHSLHYACETLGVDDNKDTSTLPTELVEPFARRGSDDPIDISPDHHLVWHIVGDDDSLPSIYKIDREKLEFGIQSIDTLFALFSIDPEIGSENTLYQTARVLIKTAEEKDSWEEVVQDEIEKQMLKLGIEDDGLDDLLERYRLVRRIQRLGAAVITREELAKSAAE